MEATNEKGKNPAGAQSRAGEAGANLSVGLAALCVCDPGWFGEMNPICNDFVSDEGHDQCKNCEHCEACHTAANAGVTGA